MTKILTRRGIVLIVMPLFLIFLQIFIRFILHKDLNTLGITFAALGVGQLFPFLYSDHFIINKVIGTKPLYLNQENTVVIKYETFQNIDNEQIEKVKNYIFGAIFFNLGLFMCVIYLGLIGHVFMHISLGIISCIITWILLIFKW